MVNRYCRFLVHPGMRIALNVVKGGFNRLRIAFAVWNDRIAPVFDVVREVHLTDFESGRVVREETGSPPAGRVADGKGGWLAERKVDVLVCGAISRPLQSVVAGYGIQVVPFVAGNLQEITRAWLDGTLESGRFVMPGCCRHRKRHRFEGHRG